MVAELFRRVAEHHRRMGVFHRPNGVITRARAFEHVAASDLFAVEVAGLARDAIQAIEAVERDLIQAALDRSGGNISESARLLGLTRRGLYLKLRRLGLDSRVEADIH